MTDAIRLFPKPRRAPPPNPSSKLAEQLGPDRDHPDEQRDRRQSRRLFHENPQHHCLLDLEHRENIVPFLFLGQVAMLTVDPQASLLVNPAALIASPANKKPQPRPGLFDSPQRLAKTLA